MNPLYVHPCICQNSLYQLFESFHVLWGKSYSQHHTSGFLRLCHLLCLRNEPKHLQLPAGATPWAAGTGELPRTAQIPHLSSSSPGSKAWLVDGAGWAPPPSPSPALSPLCVPLGHPWTLREMIVWWVHTGTALIPSCTIRTAWQTSLQPFDHNFNVKSKDLTTPLPRLK